MYFRSELHVPFTLGMWDGQCQHVWLRGLHVFGHSPLPPSMLCCMPCWDRNDKLNCAFAESVLQRVLLGLRCCCVILAMMLNAYDICHQERSRDWTSSSRAAICRALATCLPVLKASGQIVGIGLCFVWEAFRITKVVDLSSNISKVCRGQKRAVTQIPLAFEF